MSNRRMLSLQIVDTDAFLEMPQSSQLLYFHFVVRADDEGFIGSPRKIMKIIGSPNDDLRILISKRFILTFKSGIVVIKHWLIHNTIRMDRFKKTTYIEEKELLKLNENKSYTEARQPNGNQTATIGMRKLSKDKLSKDKLSKIAGKPAETDGQQINILLKEFEIINPTINYGNKTQRQAIEDMLKQFGYEKLLNTIKYAVSIQGKKFSPVITTPYQLKENMGKLLIYYKKEKTNKTIVC